MAGCDNASVPPTSEEYFTALGVEKLVFLAVDLVLTLIIFVLFVEECYFVIKTYKHNEITAKSIWLISIYPVFALTSVLAVVIPRSLYICDFVASCYLSGCLFQFSSLLMLYFGHVDHLLVKVKDTGFRLNARPCCCCVCCPVLPPTRKSLVKVRMMIFQTAVLQPIIQFIAAILWADDKFSVYGTDFTQSYIYLNYLKVISTAVALYGLIVLHGTTQPHLVTHNTKPKLMALTLIQLFSNIQSTILSIPPKYNVPPCKDGLSSRFQMIEWHHLVLVLEIFLLSVVARIYYRRPLALDAILETRCGELCDIYTPDKGPDYTEADSTPLTNQSNNNSTPTMT